MDTLCLYEPFLFGLHALGAIIWFAVWHGAGGAYVGELFALIYAGSLFYIWIRFKQRSRHIASVRSELGLTDAVVHLVPTLSWFKWQFVVESDSSFYLGEIRHGQIHIEERYGKQPYGGSGSHPIVQATMSAKGVRAFLHFAQRVHVSWQPKSDGYVVEWRDVRFWHKRKLPFGVDVQLDQNLNVVSDSLGWNKKAWDPPYV